MIRLLEINLIIMEKPSYEEAKNAKQVLIKYLEGILNYKSEEEIKKEGRAILLIALIQDYYLD